MVAENLKIENPADDFRIGVLGGLGPAATVDFMDKIIRNTPARRDQDHIRMLVEHDPRIPDRTAHLLGEGPDPTPALDAACQRLQSFGATIIAIPCNTAHVFLDAIQARLDIPIIRMPDETVAFIGRHYAGLNSVGLLATSGTVQTRLYQTVLGAAGYATLVPDAPQQTMLMEVISGKQGIKAGYTSGLCVEQFLEVATHLERMGAELLILGCTELPLLLDAIGGRSALPMVDPTDILARRCVALSGISR